MSTPKRIDLEAIRQRNLEKVAAEKREKVRRRNRRYYLAKKRRLYRQGRAAEQFVRRNHWHRWFQDETRDLSISAYWRIRDAMPKSVLQMVAWQERIKEARAELKAVQALARKQTEQLWPNNSVSLALKQSIQRLKLDMRAMRREAAKAEREAYAEQGVQKTQALIDAEKDKKRRRRERYLRAKKQCQADEPDPEGP